MTLAEAEAILDAAQRARFTARNMVASIDRELSPEYDRKILVAHVRDIAKALGFGLLKRGPLVSQDIGVAIDALMASAETCNCSNCQKQRSTTRLALERLIASHLANFASGETP